MNMTGRTMLNLRLAVLAGMAVLAACAAPNPATCAFCPSARNRSAMPR